MVAAAAGATAQELVDRVADAALTGLQAPPRDDVAMLALRAQPRLGVAGRGPVLVVGRVLLGLLVAAALLRRAFVPGDLVGRLFGVALV